MSKGLKSSAAVLVLEKFYPFPPSFLRNASKLAHLKILAALPVSQPKPLILSNLANPEVAAAVGAEEEEFFPSITMRTAEAVTLLRLDPTVEVEMLALLGGSPDEDSSKL